MKNILYIICALCLISLSSCGEETLPTESFGKVSYYPEFWLMDADTTSVTKTFSFEFNADAQVSGEDACAVFAFVDINGNIISPDELQISEGDNVLQQNSFKVDANNPSKTLTFKFLPAAKEGNHQGSLKLISSGKIERVGPWELSENANPEIFRWSLKFEKSWNPLAKFLFWFVVTVVSGLLIWFLILKKKVYPQIKVNQVQLACESNGWYLVKRIKGYREVILTETPVKQGWWSKNFKGKILYISSGVGLWTNPLKLQPKDKNRVKIVLSQHYTMNPMDNAIHTYQNYTLTQMSTNKKIKITVM